MSHYKPYPAYRDSDVEWIGQVPEHWEIKRLRHVASFTNSNVDKKSYDGQAAVSLCNYTDVYYNEFITADLPFMQATASSSEDHEPFTQKGKAEDKRSPLDSEDPCERWDSFPRVQNMSNGVQRLWLPPDHDSDVPSADKT
jgi:type I restriction enzyme S subunit